jgi:hypothetical protein
MPDTTDQPFPISTDAAIRRASARFAAALWKLHQEKAQAEAKEAK